MEEKLMSIEQQVSDYRVAQKIVHWLMAIFIMLDLFIAQKFGRVMQEWDRFESRSDHATLGSVLTILFVIRMYLRWKHGAPPLPSMMPKWQKIAADIGHWGLYILIACLITSGILSAINANSVIAPFGQFDISDGTGLEMSFLFFRNSHEFFTDAIIGLITIHILAALYHAVISRDGTTGRMLRFWQTEKRGLM
jgi:cytochrome b561